MEFCNRDGAACNLTHQPAGRSWPRYRRRWSVMVEFVTSGRAGGCRPCTRLCQDCLADAALRGFVLFTSVECRPSAHGAPGRVAVCEVVDAPGRNSAGARSSAGSCEALVF